MQENAMLEKLFGSRTRVKLLRLFLNDSSAQFFVREISRAIDEQINSVRRELQNLEEIGLLGNEERDKKKYYFVNEDFILFNELRSLILKSRLTLEKGFIKSIQNIGPIAYFALTGYFVNDPDAKVDMFLVGNVGRGKLDKLLNQFKSSFGHQLRYTIMTMEEYNYRKDITDKFLYEIINSKKLVVINKMDKKK